MSDSASDEVSEVGRGYEALFVPALFGPWTEHVLAAAKIQSGERVADVACGTGVLARAVLERVGSDGQVDGVDPAPGMLAAARKIEPRIDWHLASAEELPLSDAYCDAVVSQFGMMFFADAEAAAREMARVLRPGGRAVVVVWNAVEANPGYRDVAAFLSRIVSEAAANAVQVPFSMADPAQVTGPLQAAGFKDVVVQTPTATARFPSPRVMVEAELRGWLPLFDIHLNEDQIASVLEQAETDLAHLADDSGAAVFETSAHVVSAVC
ncbi:MAG: class I SAM-dependent methyltransferase [Paracoccaceae bacterium]